MLISLASSRANGFLRWSKNHPDIALVKTHETAWGSMNGLDKPVETDPVPSAERPSADS
jgi:hypothetical protein